jgi:flavin prenyltransferase
MAFHDTGCSDSLHGVEGSVNDPRPRMSETHHQMRDSVRRPIVLAFTGASGAAYGVRLLQQLVLAGVPVHFLISPSGAAVLSQELQIELLTGSERLIPLLQFAWASGAGESDAHARGSLQGSTDVSGVKRRWVPLTDGQIETALSHIVEHDYRNFMTPVASGSFLTSGMVVCPCSGATLSGIVHATGNNLIQRAADVHLKEHRKLIVVPRETPMSVFQLENMHRAAQAGAIVMPAMPGWYHGVTSPVDLIDFMVARILDHLDIDHDLMRRWGVEPIDCSPGHAQSGDE